MECHDIDMSVLTDGARASPGCFSYKPEDGCGLGMGRRHHGAIFDAFVG